MSEQRYYLSDQDLRDRMAQMPGEEDETDCGGWREDPPCGGCGRCIRDQQSYYFSREREDARRFQSAGFEYADPSVIFVPLAQGAEKHDSYSCWCAKEMASPIFPWDWERR